MYAVGIDAQREPRECFVGVQAEDSGNGRVSIELLRVEVPGEDACFVIKIFSVHLRLLHSLENIGSVSVRRQICRRSRQDRRRPAWTSAPTRVA